MSTVLPVIQRPIDNTAMSAYMACPREYYFGMVLHRRGKGRTAALTYGAAWHKAMEVHYRSGGNRNQVRAKIITSWEDHEGEGDYRTMDRLLLDYDQYVKEFHEDEKDFAQTLGWPENPMVELAANISGGGLLHPYAGKLDRVFLDGGLVYIVDHKTTSRLDKHYFSQFKLSNQMRGYTFLGQQLLPQYKVVGVLMNVAHVLTSKTTFHRQPVTFTPEEISEWVENTNYWTRRIAADTEDNVFPGHYGDNGCSRKFGLCQYHTVCRLSPRLRDRMLEREFEVNEWNPLEADDDLEA